MTRSLTELSALLFDSDESNAGCRLLQNAQRSWVIHAPPMPHEPTNAREHAQHLEQLRQDLH